MGRRDLAAKYIRQVMETQYGVTPDGLCGNDDCGQMSAWYIFSALGFYPFDPCGEGYVLGAPQMKEIALDVGGGRKFKVTSSKPGEALKSATLGGRAFRGVHLRHEDVMKGGELKFLR